MTTDRKALVRKLLLHGLGQLSLVVLGILIALQVENWNESGKQAARRQVLLTKIRAELTSNRDRIQQKLPARTAFLKQLQQCSETWTEQDRRGLYLDLPEAERMPAWPGMAPIRLDLAVFETAKATGLLADLDPTLFAQLSRTYGEMATINQISRGMLNQLFEIGYDTRTGDALRLFWRIQEEFFGAQELLLPKLATLVRSIDAN